MIVKNQTFVKLYIFTCPQKLFRDEGIIIRNKYSLMLNQSQLRSPKTHNHQPSNISSPNADSFFKKKPFMRKPAFQGSLFNIEQRSKNTIEHQISQQSLPNFSSPLAQQVRRESHGKKSSIVDTENRQRIFCTRYTAKESIFYSPKAQNVHFWKDLSYISDNSDEKQDKKINQIKRKNTNTEIPNLNKKFSEVQNKKDTSSQHIFKPGHVKNRSSSTTFIQEKDGIDDIKHKQNEKELSLMNSCGSKSSKQITVQCLYCKNNKKMAEILNQKYKKLQRVYTNKLRQNLQLEVMCNNLKIQNLQMKKERDKIIKQIENNNNTFETMKEDLLLKIENQREEIMKLKDKTRYNQIQKSILLRVKEDHQALTKTNLQLKNQHYIMKKTILANSQAKINNSHFQKNRKIPTPDHYRASNATNIMFNSPQSGKSEENQDDNISLDFSEFSLENIAD